jgi:hypothetical protein
MDILIDGLPPAFRRGLFFFLPGSDGKNGSVALY